MGRYDCMALPVKVVTRQVFPTSLSPTRFKPEIRRVALTIHLTYYNVDVTQCLK